MWTGILDYFVHWPTPQDLTCIVDDQYIFLFKEMKAKEQPESLLQKYITVQATKESFFTSLLS